MSRKRNHGYGKAIADAVLSNVDDAEFTPRTTWLDSWTDPSERRARSRRWLSMFLKADLKNVPHHLAVKYLTEMAKDISGLGTDEAVNRFVDKILPIIISNKPPETR